MDQLKCELLRMQDGSTILKTLNSVPSDEKIESLKNQVEEYIELLESSGYVENSYNVMMARIDRSERCYINGKRSGYDL